MKRSYGAVRFMGDCATALACVRDFDEQGDRGERFLWAAWLQQQELNAIEWGKRQLP